MKRFSLTMLMSTSRPLSSCSTGASLFSTLGAASTHWSSLKPGHMAGEALVRVTINTKRVSHSSTNMVTRKSDSLVADMNTRVHFIRDVTTVVWHLKMK